MKRMLSAALALIIALCGTITVLAANPVSRTIEVFSVGGTVKMTKGTAKEFNAKKGAKLYDGYSLSTGASSSASLKLDDGSLVKLDQRTKLSISKASGKKLSVSVVSGGVSVDAQTQTGGNALEIRAGNSSLAVRGTSFTFEIPDGGGIMIAMFSGGGEVNGQTLAPGRAMVLTDTAAGGGKAFEEAGIKDVMGNLSAFALETVYEKADSLVDGGIFTREEMNELPKAIEKAKTDQTEREKRNEQLRREERTQINTGNVGGGGSSGSSSGGSSGSSGSSGGNSGGTGGSVNPTYPVNPPSYKVVAIIWKNNIATGYYWNTSSTNSAVTRAIADAVAAASSSPSTVTLEIRSDYACAQPLTLPDNVRLTISNDSTFTLESDLTAMTASAIYIDTGSKLEAAGQNTLLIEGTLINDGELIINESTVTTNDSMLTNNGEFVLNDSIVDINSSTPAFTFTNYGEFVMYGGEMTVSGASVENYGKIWNRESLSSPRDYGEMTFVDLVFVNKSTVTYTGILENDANCLIEFAGTVAGTGVDFDDSEFTDIRVVNNGIMKFTKGSYNSSALAIGGSGNSLTMPTVLFGELAFSSLGAETTLTNFHSNVSPPAQIVVPTNTASLDGFVFEWSFNADGNGNAGWAQQPTPPTPPTP